MKTINYPKNLSKETIEEVEKNRTEKLKKISEGEEFIQTYLDGKSVRYVPQYPLFLKEDTKRYRLADFYLPEYNICIEFFGQYNSPEGRKRYYDKKDSYEKNGIKCIYTYPENLGFFDFIFKRRLLDELRKKGNCWSLLRYTINVLILDSMKWVLGLIMLLLYLLIAKATTLTDKLVYGVFILFLVASLVIEVIKVWKK